MAQESKRILSTRSMMMYGLGLFGVQLFIGFVNSFQMEFYNKMYSGFVGSRIFYATAIIILVAKLISCIADPIFGSLIDRSNLKGGKMRPWIKRSALPIAIMTTVLFVYIPFSNLGPKAGEVVMYIYIAITTIMWNVAMTFADIPSGGMLGLLSPNANERNAAAGIGNTLKSIALAIPGVFMTVIMMIVGAIMGNPAETDPAFIRANYLTTALVFMVIGTVLYMLIYWFNRESVTSNSRAVTMKEMFVELKDNKLIRIVFLTFMLGFARNMAMGICVQAGGALVGMVKIPVLSDILAGGEAMDPTTNATWLIGITSAITSMVSIVIVPMINKKWGEKKTFIAFAIYGGVVSLITYALYVIWPFGDVASRTGASALIFILVCQAIVGFMFGPHGYLPMVMTSDIVDYREWKTGERKDGVCFAILSMSNKVANALSVAVGVLFLAISQYTNEVYTNNAVTESMQNIIFWAYMAMPGVACLLSMIPMFWYKLDTKTKAQMHAELDARRAAEGQALNQDDAQADIVDTQEAASPDAE